MKKLKHVRVLPSLGGRYAIYARIDKDSPWVQVESVYGAEMAEQFAIDADWFEDNRKSYIEECEGDRWDDSEQAITPPVDGE